MRLTIALLAIFPVAACAPGAGIESAATLSESWLVGSWVPVGENCASDAGMVYDADRTWHAEGTTGTWSIEADRIVTVATQQDDGVTGMRTIAPERSEQRVEAVRPNRFVSHMGDGTVLRWVRCDSVG